MIFTKMIGINLQAALSIIAALRFSTKADKVASQDEVRTGGNLSTW